MLLPNFSSGVWVDTDPVFRGEAREEWMPSDAHTWDCCDGRVDAEPCDEGRHEERVGKKSRIGKRLIIGSGCVADC